MARVNNQINPCTTVVDLWNHKKGNRSADSRSYSVRVINRLPYLYCWQGQLGSDSSRALAGRRLSSAAYTRTRAEARLMDSIMEKLLKTNVQHSVLVRVLAVLTVLGLHLVAQETIVALEHLQNTQTSGMLYVICPSQVILIQQSLDS